MDLIAWLFHWMGRFLRPSLTGSGSIYFPGNTSDIRFSGSLASIETSTDIADVSFPNDNYVIYYSGNTGTVYGAN